MKAFTQEQVEEIVTGLLLTISKDNGDNAKVADESIKVINNTVDYNIFSGIVLTKIRPSICNEREEDFKVDVMAYLQNMYEKCYEVEKLETNFNVDLAKNFDPNDITKSYTTQMQFALSHFANAYFAYEEIEGKYPELMKFL